MLVEAGYRTLPFENARLALDAMERGARPDLILLDLMMPGMDGWTFRLQQRQNPELRDIPVVAVSADASPQAAAIDADAYLRKPVDFGRLRLVVEQVLAQAERRQLFLRGVELERLRSLGMLVATIAHEVNNPLAATGGYLDLSLRSCQRMRDTPASAAELAERLEPALEAAREGTDRITSIVRLLLTFARGGDDNAPGPADATRAIEAAISLAAPQIRQKAILLRDFHEVGPVAVHEARLAQVFLNLLINAAHAIESGRAEQSHIEVKAWQERDHGIFEVTDDGCGIPKEILERIFEPFFSTKPVGRGTGLGLSISREIIQRAGGTISVRSRAGAGTTFRVELPVVSSGRAEERDRARVPSDAREHAYRVLVVDDEPLVGRMLAALWEKHDVHVFEDAEQALAELGQQHFDLVLCDWMMPKMTGEQFYRALGRMRPDLAEKFVLMTGAAPSVALERLAQELRHPVLKKPFSPASLDDCLELVPRQRVPPA
jgi:signal transduction histidine kinase